jgi:hypothetical protein
MIVVVQCAARKRPDAGMLQTKAGVPVLFVADPTKAPNSPAISMLVRMTWMKTACHGDSGYWSTIETMRMNWALNRRPTFTPIRPIEHWLPKLGSTAPLFCQPDGD